LNPVKTTLILQLSNAKKILVTGANGQLGMEFRALQQDHPHCTFIFAGRAELSITDYDRVTKLFESEGFDYCINCAAYTLVDKAEEETALANKINGEAVGHLAGICAIHKVKFIQVSTDYVFDGNAREPIKESAKVDPVNAYGRSKMLGEALALDKHGDTIILRTSWLYSRYGKNFVKTMIKLMSEKEHIKVVNDQYGSPTYAADLADAIMQVINTKFQPGVYHYCNEGVTSWYDFACAIKELKQFDCTIEPVDTSAYPTTAKRPSYSAMDTSLFKSTFGIAIPQWRQSLEDCLKLL
jgi:dTDP-4-dehydrorhamnose reductase